MPRTPIPKHLIHQPEEVERDGKRFDYLCRLAEEVAVPIVERALFREYHETASTGAEILGEEAKHALETLAAEASFIQDLDEETVIQNLQKSLSDVVPPPDEEECRQHTRDFSQVLMSTWIETVRTAHAEMPILELSDWLLPVEQSGRFARLRHWFVSSKSNLSETVTDAVASFALNESDIVAVLATLREKLFAEPRLVDLPFDLAMVGAPAATAAGATDERQVSEESERPSRIMVMSRPFFERLYKTIEQIEPRPAEPRRALPAYSVPTPQLRPPAFVTSRAQLAAEKLSVPLLPRSYRVFAGVASLSPAKLEPAKLESSVRTVAAAI